MYKLLLFLVIMVSCKSPNGRNTKIEMVSEKGEILNDISSSTLADTVYIEEGNFKLSVISNYIYNENQERPIYFNQNLLLCENNKILYSHIHDAEYDSIQTKSGFLKYLKNFITKIGLIRDNGKNYFIVKGWGGCNYCSTYSLIIDDKGKLKYKLFRNEKSDTIYSKLGDLNKIFLTENKLKSYLKGKYELSQEVCDKCLKSNLKNSFNDPYNE